MSENGLVIVFTGEGKGKTSAAMGIAMRSAGHRMYVSVVQFIKTAQPAGEARAGERLLPEVEFLSLGKGFVNGAGSTIPFEEHRKAAGEALAAARQRITAGAWDVVILDEINTAVGLGLLSVPDVVALLKARPSRLHLVLTGRDAPADVIALADLVTEMRSIKHPFDQGRSAQRGIDY